MPIELSETFTLHKTSQPEKLVTGADTTIDHLPNRKMLADNKIVPEHHQTFDRKPSAPGLG
jgi:hypothetical protein